MTIQIFCNDTFRFMIQFPYFYDMIEKMLTEISIH